MLRKTDGLFQIYGICTPTFVIDACKEFTTVQKSLHGKYGFAMFYKETDGPRRNPGEICEKKLRSYDNLLLHTWPKDQGLALTSDLLWKFEVLSSLDKWGRVVSFNGGNDWVIEKKEVILQFFGQ